MSWGDAGLAHDAPRADVGVDPRPFAGEVAAGLAPGAGLADASGIFPSFSVEDQRYYDGLITNIENGQYGIAALQGLAMFGDALWAGGPIAGAAGTFAKMPLALSRAMARQNKNFRFWQEHGLLSKGPEDIRTPKFVSSDGHPHVLNHGTTAEQDFDIPRTRKKELGMHLDVTPLGEDPAQALDFITARKGAPFARTSTDPDDWLDHGRIMPVYTNVSNPLNIPDLGTWDVTHNNIYEALYSYAGISTVDIIRRLPVGEGDSMRRAAMQNLQRRLKDEMKIPGGAHNVSPDHPEVARWYNDDDPDTFIRGWMDFFDGEGMEGSAEYMAQIALLSSAGNRAEYEMLHRAVHGTIMDNGYDGIVYFNRHEGLPQRARAQIGHKHGDISWERMNDDEWAEAFYDVFGSEPPVALIVFSPSQVKSAVGNTGEYSRAVDSITDSTGDRFIGSGFEALHPTPASRHDLTELLASQGRSVDEYVHPMVARGREYKKAVDMDMQHKAPMDVATAKQMFNKIEEDSIIQINPSQYTKDKHPDIADMIPAGNYRVVSKRVESPGGGEPHVAMVVENLADGSETNLASYLFDELPLHPSVGGVEPPLFEVFDAWVPGEQMHRLWMNEAPFGTAGGVPKKQLMSAHRFTGTKVDEVFSSGHFANHPDEYSIVIRVNPEMKKTMPDIAAEYPDGKWNVFRAAKTDANEATMIWARHSTTGVEKGFTPADFKQQGQYGGTLLDLLDVQLHAAN